MVNEGDGTAHAIRIGQGRRRERDRTLGVGAAGAVRPGAGYGAASPPPTRRFSLGAADRVGDNGGVRDGQRKPRELASSRPWCSSSSRRSRTGTALLRRPPYAINPIREQKDLFGRDSILSDLELHVSNETSTFLWGQKRGGQDVRASGSRGEPGRARRFRVHCAEDGGTGVAARGATRPHGGQSARGRPEVSARSAVGERVQGRAGPAGPLRRRSWPARAAGRCSSLSTSSTDLNPAFYLGERGKQFVKALRSLSEVGLTFMFVGSERMDSIYRTHSADLNKWVKLFAGQHRGES